MTPINVGALLNTTRVPTQCPECFRPSLMAVHEHATRWECGHTRALPPLRKRQGINAYRPERTA